MITAGEVLKKKRETLGRSLELVSQETKIQKRFLQYIEDNDFSKFDSTVFLTGFLKIYSQHLGLDTEKILALYRRSEPKKKNNVKSAGSIWSKYKKIVLTPKSIITGLSILFFILILGYIGLQIYKFQSPSKLSVISPVAESVVTTDTLTVEGTTQPGATVEINASLADVDDQGYFKQDIALKLGVNIITIKARKNNSSILETVETRKVTYNKPLDVETPIETIKSFLLTVEVKDSASWIKLDVDNENKISKVVDPSKQQYEIKNNFYIITGRASNTTISVNDQPLAWKSNSTTGVAEVRCTILSEALSCE